MSTQEFFASRLAMELSAFANVIRALPGDKLDYKPHEKNTPAGALAWQLVCEMSHLPDLFSKGEVHYEATECPTVDDMVAAIEQHGRRAVEAAKATSDERWNSPAKFYMGGQVVWETNTADMAWGYLFDMVHHRGQLSTYIRPMGGKVPSIYGPSGDAH